MASTRHPPPLQIFQDPVSSFDPSEIPQLPLSTSSQMSPRRPLKNVSAKRNVVLNPPPSAPSRPSPVKLRHPTSPSKSQCGSKFNILSIPPPRAPEFTTDSPLKKQRFQSWDGSGSHNPQKALFTTFSTSQPADKENLHPIAALNNGD